uniref:Uncharacterized protein n=1 Tax=Arundo donax TaxID=35708 RepID=A0A0A9CQ03_ARUDO
MIPTSGLLHQEIHQTEGQQEVNPVPVRGNLPKTDPGHVVRQRLEHQAVVQDLMGVKVALRQDHQLPLALVGEKENQVQTRLTQRVVMLKKGSPRRVSTRVQIWT